MAIHRSLFSDGSAHRISQIGNAGLLSLLDWGARALPKCADETHGAELAMHLHEKYVLLCHAQGLAPLSLWKDMNLDNANLIRLISLNRFLHGLVLLLGCYNNIFVALYLWRSYMT